jgi:hypothetical protein
MELGYTFNTEQEAQDAVNTLNIYYGIPVSPDAVTQTWCDYYEKEDKWFINYDESMIPVLGQPIEINI